MVRRPRTKTPHVQESTETPVGVRRGYVRPMSIAMALAAVAAVVWAVVQGLIQ